MAYKAQYRLPEDFRVNGVALTQKEYDEQVRKTFEDPVLQNEIHGLLNDYAEKLVRLTKTTEETAFARGAVDALNRLLVLVEKGTVKKVKNVV